MYISTAQASDEDSEKSSGRYITRSHFPFSATLLKSFENLKVLDHQTNLNLLLNVQLCLLLLFFLRTLLRVAAPTAGRDSGPAHFSELSPMGADPHDSSALRRSRKVVEYFWIPTEQE